MATFAELVVLVGFNPSTCKRDQIRCAALREKYPQIALITASHTRIDAKNPLQDGVFHVTGDFASRNGVGNIVKGVDQVLQKVALSRDKVSNVTFDYCSLSPSSYEGTCGELLIGSFVPMILKTFPCVLFMLPEAHGSGGSLREHICTVPKKMNYTATFFNWFDPRSLHMPIVECCNNQKTNTRLVSSGFLTTMESVQEHTSGWWVCAARESSV